MTGALEPVFLEATNCWNEHYASLTSDSFPVGTRGLSRTTPVLSVRARIPSLTSASKWPRPAEGPVAHWTSSNNSSLTWMQRCNGTIIPQLGLSDKEFRHPWRPRRVGLKRYYVLFCFLFLTLYFYRNLCFWIDWASLLVFCLCFSLYERTRTDTYVSRKEFWKEAELVKK